MALEHRCMERLDRAALIWIVVAVMLGFVAWSVASSLGYVAAELLIEWWEGDGNVGTFGAEFSVGGVDVDYGQLLAAVITFLFAMLLAVPLLRYAARRRVT